jgi:hypothetical protein
MMTNQSAFVAGRFDGHTDALKRQTWHRPMQQIQGHTRCPWQPPSGNYSLCIAPAAARATGKQTTINKYTKKGGHVHGCSGAPVQYRVHRPMEEVQGFAGSHWTPPSGKFYVQ